MLPYSPQKGSTIKLTLYLGYDIITDSFLKKVNSGKIVELTRSLNFKVEK